VEAVKQTADIAPNPSENLLASQGNNILMESIEEIMASLPPEHQQEVRDFAMFLAEKRAKPKRRRLRLDWAEGLKEFRDQYTSLNLQKDSLNWWDD
jgi:hypothetical protein